MASFTGSVQDAAHILSPYFEKGALHLSLNQGTTATPIREGQEVYISATGQVLPRTDGTQFPIGTVSVGKGVGPMVTVATIFNRDLNGVAGTAAIAAGTLVRQNATLGTEDEPEYVAAAAGDYVLGVALAAASPGGPIRVGVLRSPFKF